LPPKWHLSGRERILAKSNLGRIPTPRRAATRLARRDLPQEL